MALIIRNLLFRNLSIDFQTLGKVSSAGYCRVVDNPTAGIIVIGDEILKAQVKDTNSNFICNLLYDCGVRVKKISVIGDEVDCIAEEIVAFSKKYTYVITSGGIGPTHDDVTFEALAKAFDDSLHHHPKLVEVVRAFSGAKFPSSPSYKLAYVPTSATLRFGRNAETGQRLMYPCVGMQNVYVFPGSPTFLQRSFGALCKELFGTDKNFVTRELHLGVHEELFADALSAVSREFPNVTFGSYPIMNHSYYLARVTIESSTQEDTDRALTRFMELAPSKSVVNYDSEPLKDAVKKFKAFVSTDKQGPLFEATLSSLKEMYKQQSGVAICFDGSIETTVLLHLVHINHLLEDGDKIEALYLKREHPFQDIDNFIKETVARYDLKFHTLEGSIDGAIQELGLRRPELGTLLLGTRGDKIAEGGWHALSRTGGIGRLTVRLPLTQWTYKDVWHFARSLSLPYCKLYDLGYTSLGNRSETSPNPNLVKIKSPERTIYHPAHMLTDTSLERAGRSGQNSSRTRRI